MNLLKTIAICFLINFTFLPYAYADLAMTNVYGRDVVSLNGQWDAIIDPTGIGDWRKVWEERKPAKKTDFFEYSFDGGPSLTVPGSFNTQLPEITFLEGTVWYKKTFTAQPSKHKRLFLHFGGVNYQATVYLNGNKIGDHEGGFTPFQFEITDTIRNGENTVIVKADNRRLKDGLPGLGYDWFNYGGITRDVHLVKTNRSFIEDYSIQLKSHSLDEVEGWVKVVGDKPSQTVEIVIPELNISHRTKTNDKGLAKVNFKSEFDLWSPQNPRLYQVIIKTETDTVSETIGFRSIEVSGTKILLNGESIFLKGVNIHEENPLTAAKAVSEADARLLLTWAKDLGCNIVRLAHYPHNEYMAKLADEMGLMVWVELPVYQHIEFSAPGMKEKMDLMLTEMIRRDRNRSSVVIWSLSNETYDFTPQRNEMLAEIAKTTKRLDDTRLITSVINNQGYDNNTVNVWDTLYRHFDILSINEYLGWYVPWQGKPEDTKWKLSINNKPVFISEFGGEALYGSNFGPKDEAAYWSEEYQERIYKDQVKMFANTPNLVGVAPWLLVDYRSLGRMHPVYQQGWNRKGLLSDKGERKKAWHVMKTYFDNVENSLLK